MNAFRACFTSAGLKLTNPISADPPSPGVVNFSFSLMPNDHTEIENNIMHMINRAEGLDHMQILVLKPTAGLIPTPVSPHQIIIFTADF